MSHPAAYSLLMIIRLLYRLNTFMQFCLLIAEEVLQDLTMLIYAYIICEQ